MAEMTVSEAREKFSDLIGKVQHGREDVTIIRHGKPVAVVIPAEACVFYQSLWDAQLVREIEAHEASPDYDPNDTISAKDLFAQLRAEEAAEAAE